MAKVDDFAAERELFNLWRPRFGNEVCLFVPNHEYGLRGFVTFGSDAQQLTQALSDQPEPDYFAYHDMLWIPDASETRKRRLEAICGRTHCVPIRTGFSIVATWQHLSLSICLVVFGLWFWTVS